MKNFLLKSIPYLLSIAGGAALFWMTSDKIGDANLRDLVNNIAASLLSIPLVFLLYDYSNYWISRRIKRTLADNTHDKIDILLLNVIINMRHMMGLHGKLTLESLNKMGEMKHSQIANKIKLGTAELQDLQECHHELDILIYHNAGATVLTAAQIQALANLERNILHLMNVRHFRQDKKVAAKYIAATTQFVIDWIDSDASAALHFQQLTSGDSDPTNTEK